MTTGGHYCITYQGKRERHQLMISAAGDGRERAIRFAKERGASAVVWHLPGPDQKADRIWPPYTGTEG